MHVKKWILISLLLVLLAAGCTKPTPEETIPTASTLADPVSLAAEFFDQKVIASVGEREITVGTYQTQVKYSRYNIINQAYSYYQYSQMLGASGNTFLVSAQQLLNQIIDPYDIGERVLDRMIENLVMEDEAQQLGITVSAAEVDAAMQAAFNYYPDGTPVPTPTRQISTPTLSATQQAILGVPETTQTAATGEPGEATPSPTQAATPTPYTTQAYAEAVQNFLVNLGDVNMTYEELQTVFRNQILRNKIKEAVTGDVETTKEKVWARHMLVETREKALELQQKLLEGANWEALVEEENALAEGTIRAEDLGWFGSGVMVEEFELIAFSLPIGEISPPVETTYGWHIIQVLGRGPVDLDDNELSAVKDAAFSSWLAQAVASRTDISRVDNWRDYVPNAPIVPEQLSELIFGSD